MLLRKIFLRHATPQDYAACKHMANQKENRAGLGFVSRVVFNDFAARQVTDPRYMLFVAESDSGVVGYIRALRLLKKDQVTIHEVCRDINVRGQGIGKALIDHVAAKSNGLPLALKTPADAPAARLYEQYGFRLTGTEKPYKRVLRRYERP